MTADASEARSPGPIAGSRSRRGDAGAADSFEAAERALFERHGLMTSARHLALEEPALTARVIESGDGDPVVFVHGGGSCAAEWAPLLGELTDRRCLSVDRPGCGGTDFFDYTGVDLRRHAVAFLDGLLDALELRRASFVGQSMGGLWSLWLALERPERVSALVLLGAPALILGSSAPLSLRMLGVRGLNRLLFRLEAPSRKQAGKILNRLFGPDAAERMTPEFVEVVHRAELLPGAQTSFRTLLERAVRLRGGRLTLGEDELRLVAPPALFVWGERDVFAGPRFGRRACAAMPNARLEVVEGGHGPWWDDPRRCAELITSWLRSPATVATEIADGYPNVNA